MSINKNQFKSEPKSDPHVHLLLSAPIDAYRSLSATQFPKIPERYASFKEFANTIINHYFPVFSSLENVAVIVRAAFEQMIADNVTYTEASLPLGAPLRIGASWKEYAAAINDEVKRVAGRLNVKLELGHTREQQIDWRKIAAQALDTGIFSGVDLYGDETFGDISEFKDFFDAARANSLHVKIHCGEFTDAAHMKHDVEIARPDAIQHGIAAATDRELMAQLKDYGIPLNVCPSSNVMLRGVKSYSSHPIKTLVAAELNVRIGTDDYGLFGVSLSEEYQRLLETSVLSATELEAIRIRALEERR